jgi:hypothetical protein
LTKSHQRKVEWSSGGFRWHILGMTHRVTPLVEVAAPNGTKSLLAAFSVARADAVATVKKVIPFTYTAELSFSTRAARLEFGGARPGDIILIKHSHAG